MKSRRSTPLRRVVVVAVLSIVPALIVSAQIRDRDSDWTAPPERGSVPNPLASRPDTAAGGAKLFQHRCAACHGPEGRGTRKAPSLVDSAVQAQPDGALFWKISSGNAHAGMPAFSFLPELQRWQVVLHLRALVAPAPSHDFDGLRSAAFDVRER